MAGVAHRALLEQIGDSREAEDPLHSARQILSGIIHLEY
jgi:hypothetical protein